MATKLMLRNTTLNGITDAAIASIIYDMVTTAGAGVDTAVTNSQAGTGWEAQATKTAGGSTVAWVSGRAPAGGFTLTQADISAWQVESNMNANIGGRMRVYKYSGGTLTELGGGPFDDGVEMNTADREDTWIGNVTDTAFAEDDRIVLKYFVVPVGTGASGHTGTMKFNAADAATGDSFFNIAETVTFKAESQTISGVGAIASDEAFGTDSVNMNVAAAGDIATGEAFGTHAAHFTLPTVGGIASDEAFGSHQVNLTIVGVGAIASDEAFGTATLTVIGEQTVDVTGNAIASAEAFGTLTTTIFVGPAGNIATDEAFGAHQANFTITGAGNIASAEAFGTLAAHFAIGPAGNIASAEAFGATRLNLALALTGIASDEAFGAHSLGSVNSISGAGAIASGEAFGASTLSFIVNAIGVATAEAFGAHQVQPGPVTISIPGIPSDEAFGVLTVARILFLPEDIAITVDESGAVTLTLTISGEVLAAAVQDVSRATAEQSQVKLTV